MRRSLPWPAVPSRLRLHRWSVSWNFGRYAFTIINLLKLLFAVLVATSAGFRGSLAMVFSTEVLNHVIACVWCPPFFECPRSCSLLL